jgi:hypothetical protein
MVQTTIGATSSASPSLVTYNGQTFLFSIDPALKTIVCSMSLDDGYTWGSGFVINDQISADEAPALTVFGDTLFLAYRDSTNSSIQVANSVDGVNWTAPVKITVEISSHRPAMAVFKNKLYVVFKKKASELNVWKVTSDDGHTWAAATTMPVGISTIVGPSLAATASTLILSYVGMAPAQNIFNAVSTDGVNFTAKLLTNLSSNDAPSIIATGVNDFLVMFKSKATTDGMCFSRSIDNGTTWSAIIKVDPAIKTLKGPAVAVLPNQSLLLVYLRDPDSQICQATAPSAASVDKGWNFSQQLWMQTNRSPAVFGFENLLYMVYKNASNNSILQAKSLDNGKSWIQQQAVALLGQTSSDPALCIDKDGNQHLVFLNINKNIQYKMSSDDGVTWSTGDLLPNIVNDPPSIAVNNKTGQVVCVWRDSTNNIQLVKKNPADVAWSLPVTINTTYLAKSRPSLVISDDGRFHLVFMGLDNYVSYATTTDVDNWYHNAVSLDSKTTKSPGLTLHNGKPLAVWRDFASQKIWYSTCSDIGSNWLPAQALPEATIKTDYEPVVASCSSTPHLVIRGQDLNLSANNLFHVDGTDQTNWTTPSQILTNVTSLEAPGLGVQDDTVYFCYKNASEKIVTYVSQNSGENWDYTFVGNPNIAPITGPAVTSGLSKLFLAYQGAGNEVWNATSNLSPSLLYFTAENKIVGSSTNAPPAVTGTYDKILMVWKDTPDNTIWQSSYTETGGWTTPTLALNNITTDYQPALTTVVDDDGVNYKFHLVYQTGTTVLHSWSTDGVTWNDSHLVESTKVQNFAVTSHNNKLYFVYKSTTVNQLFYKISLDQGETWSAPIAIPNPSATTPASTPAIVSSGGQLLVTYRGIDKKLYLTTGTDRIDWTSNWGTQRSVTTGWMEALYDKIKTKKLEELMIPGTHNSGAYGTFAQPDISKCQTLNITQQLNNGIYYFDFKFAATGSTGSWSYFIHNNGSVSNIPLTEIFAPIQTFLQSYPKEILIVNMSQFQNFTNLVNYTDFFSKVWTYIGGFAAQKSTLPVDPRVIEDFVTANTRVILVTDADPAMLAPLYVDYLWKIDSIINNSNWASYNPFIVRKQIETQMWGLQDKTKLWLAPFILTPKTPLGFSSVLACANAINPESLKWLSDWRGGYNIATSDFIQDSFVDMILNQNRLFF